MQHYCTSLYLILSVCKFNTTFPLNKQANTISPSLARHDRPLSKSGRQIFSSLSVEHPSDQPQHKLECSANGSDSADDVQKTRQMTAMAVVMLMGMASHIALCLSLCSSVLILIQGLCCIDRLQYYRIFVVEYLILSLLSQQVDASSPSDCLYGMRVCLSVACPCMRDLVYICSVISNNRDWRSYQRCVGSRHNA